MGLYDPLGWNSCISLVSTEIFDSFLWWQYDKIIKDCSQLGHVMPVRSGYDKG